ncbi:MAG: pyroglutamyl-peptidase I [Xanthobacteraceae bacterium]|nr:pyroglutamyl-peptidase I [Xanthobacteraceae bacterium]
MRILLVGFGPFPSAPFNPSAVLVKALARRRRPALADASITAHILATDYAVVDREIPKLLAAKPDIVLIFGFAACRRALCIETRARNAVSLLFPDVSGHRPLRGDIVPGGPAALRGAAPFADLLGALRGGRIPARLSRDAGRYLCNYAYWHTLERARSGRPLVQFIHIPPTRLGSRPLRRHKPAPPSFASLSAAAEKLLIALIAASRR